MKTISNLESEVTSLNSNLDRVVKSLKMLNNGSDTLDEILQVGRVTGDKSGLWFNEKKKHISEEPSSNSTRAKSKPKMSNQMSEHHGKHHGKKKFTHTRKKSQP